MKASEIHINDLHRIFVGNLPLPFYVELVIRSFFIFLLLTICMRLIGKRMTAHINLLELVALVSLASSIGVPLLTPDRGLLPSTIIAFMIVGITILIPKISFRNVGFQKFTQGKYDVLVTDGVIDLYMMKKSRITHEELFGHLRSENVRQLGEVKRVYLETNGVFTIVKNPQPVAGLLVLPEFDTDFIKIKVDAREQTVCKLCGAPRENKKYQNNSVERCNNCGGKEWGKGVIAK